MTWIPVTAAVIGGWIVLSAAVAIAFGQAVRIANQRTPRRPSPARRRASTLDRVVEIATGAIPIIRPRMVDAATGAIPIIRRRLD
ncbi:hypothetical protein [Amnibacterium sp.]|uniref:hypothetical protein n=1 Tax=Amnibacterium sp. TaxID=1872496 RepID=UPI0026052ED4|nr:hypothetical protein [Amnibacterium sp.]MCU1474843.1 hypothetical protein [Amnibacterium sp.]